MTDKQGVRSMGACGLGLMLLFVSRVWAEPIVVGEKPQGRVERAVFATQISDREPVDALAVVDTSLEEIYYFTELRQLSGRTITHRWEYAGEVVAQIRFEVGGPRWRVFSKKSLLPTQTGTWTVVVVDETGWALHASMFEYKAREDRAEMPADAVPVQPDVIQTVPDDLPEAPVSPPEPAVPAPPQLH